MNANRLDAELGSIIIVRTTRAKQVIIRAEVDGIKVTVPPHVLLTEIRAVIEKNRQRIKLMKKRAEDNSLRIDLNFSVETDVMRLHIVEGERDGFYVNRKPGECTIICPRGTDFDPIQDWLKKVVLEQLRIQAKVYLYNRTVDVARQYGFEYSSIKIQSSRTRWGSCSGNNSINLSLFLMVVPSHLIDYVIKHELCHTVHHNHSSAFWELMDKVTDNKARQLRKELAGCSMLLF